MRGRQAGAGVSRCVAGAGGRALLGRVLLGDGSRACMCHVCGPLLHGVGSGLGLVVLRHGVRSRASVSKGAVATAGRAHPGLQWLGRCLGLAAHTRLEGVDVIHCILPLIHLGLLIKLVCLVQGHRLETLERAPSWQKVPFSDETHRITAAKNRHDSTMFARLGMSILSMTRSASTDHPLSDVYSVVLGGFVFDEGGSFGDDGPGAHLRLGPL